MKIIHITTGDPDGIGLEVSLKALSEIGPIKNTAFVLWRSAKVNEKIFSLLKNHWHRKTITINSFTDKPFTDKPFTEKPFTEKPFTEKPFTDKPFTEKSFTEKSNTCKKTRKNIFADKPVTEQCNTCKNIWDMALPPTPARWVIEAGRRCLKNPKKEALVTGPLSKTQIKKEKFFKEKGHTDLLKSLTGEDHVFMAFLGEFFNVVLLTDHIPLKKIRWSEKSLSKCVSLCFKFKKNLPQNSENQKLALLGLNPHAGEGGLLGKEEDLFKPLLKKGKNKIEGPLVPDIAFLKENWKKYFIYLCLYHDQALIPFKMIHGRKSFQVNLGLPFLRASVSHGTAKDIFGQNKAQPDSMKKALLWTLGSLN